MKKWLSKNKSSAYASARERSLKAMYGINTDFYNRLYTEQNGKCAICSKNQVAKLSVDHNHVNGSVRGLLCVSCNVGLGMFKDNQEIMAKAIDYLKKSGQLNG